MSAAALVVALLGSTPLGHALASQVPRNSVGPLQIKRNAVGPQKIAPNAVRTGHVLDGSLLTADFKPGQIPQGPKGEKGDPGPPGLAEREVVTAVSALDSSNTKQQTAVCPSGKVAVGGGGAVTNSQVLAALAESRPVIAGASPPSRWNVIGREMVATNNNWALIAFAVCARVS